MQTTKKTLYSQRYWKKDYKRLPASYRCPITPEQMQQLNKVGKTVKYLMQYTFRFDSLLYPNSETTGNFSLFRKNVGSSPNQRPSYAPHIVNII